MSRHADIHKAWRTDDVFSNRMGVTLDKSAWNENAHVVMSFLGMDPPEQTRLRKLVSRSFTPRRVAEMEPRIAAISLEHLENALAMGEFDWITDFAGKFPMDVISELLGVPPSDRDEVRRHNMEAPGVVAVHDLHAWTITSGMNVLSAHVVMGPDGNPGGLLDHLSDCLSGDFDIDHSTFQLETPEHVLWEGRADRVQLFARMDLAVSVLTVAAQLVVHVAERELEDGLGHGGAAPQRPPQPTPVTDDKGLAARTLSPIAPEGKQDLVTPILVGVTKRRIDDGPARLGWPRWPPAAGRAGHRHVDRVVRGHARPGRPRRRRHRWLGSHV